MRECSKRHSLRGCVGPLVNTSQGSPTYGYITSTPKPGWKMVDVVGYLSDGTVPCKFDTDVNAPALAEHMVSGPPVDGLCRYALKQGWQRFTCILFNFFCRCRDDGVSAATTLGRNAPLWHNRCYRASSRGSDLCGRSTCVLCFPPCFSTVLFVGYFWILCGTFHVHSALPPAIIRILPVYDMNSCAGHDGTTCVETPKRPCVVSCALSCRSWTTIHSRLPDLLSYRIYLSMPGKWAGPRLQH